ncbi:MAG: hypothetical protein NTZ56_19400 [Acidobacteria bacterium]|nr:hypothetical protein [Acidobacteriota bacterium]
MTQAEFEERSYEAPLYNQLERGQKDIFTPGQVLESRVGFDRGLLLTQAAIWETLGYDAPLRGAALGYYDWPDEWGPPHPRRQLPRFRLNLFLQAKRPEFYKRKPRALRGITTIDAPLWAFRVTKHQQRLLEVLAQKTRGRAHVAYAAAAFHTNSELFTHTKRRTIVQSSTFPSAAALTGHETWYYKEPGAQGAANPNPESIEEQPLLQRVRSLAEQSAVDTGGELAWLDALAANVIDSVGSVETADALQAQFFDDLHTLDRLSEMYELRPSFKAYAQVTLFTLRFGLTWLVLGAG